MVKASMGIRLDGITLEKVDSGCYRVYFEKHYIGIVKRTVWTSGTATLWKAENSKSVFNNIQDRTHAIIALVRDCDLKVNRRVSDGFCVND